jgi:hypothetical protein
MENFGFATKIIPRVVNSSALIKPAFVRNDYVNVESEWTNSSGV